jgi:hypothetical protein
MKQISFIILSYLREDCQHFLGFSTVSKLKAARRRKQLTECLGIFENQGIYDETAIFTLSLASDGSEADA